MAQDTIRLSGPGELVGMIPHLLGFSPADNDVVLSFFEGTTLRLSCRLDAGEGLAERVAFAREVAEREYPGATYMVIGYDDIDPAVFPTALDVVVVKGDRWLSVLCDDLTCCPPGGNPIKYQGAAEMVVRGYPTRESRDAIGEPGEVTEDAVMSARLITPMPERDAELIRVDALDRDSQLEARDTWLDIAMHSGDDALVPYVLAAYLSWRVGDGGTANVLLDRAAAINPDYPLIGLVRVALIVNPATFPGFGKTV